MFKLSDNYELAAIEIKPGKSFRILVENDGVRRKVFWISYRPDGSVYTASYVPNPRLGSVKSIANPEGAHIDLTKPEWHGKLGDAEHPYISFHGSGRIQAPRATGAQAATPSTEHLGFRLRDIREHKLLCWHIMPGPNIYPQQDTLKRLDSCFANIGRSGLVPMFQISAMPFFSPSDMAATYPRDGKRSVAFITRRLSSGIKLMVRVALDYADGSEAPQYHTVIVPAHDMKGGLILPK